MLILELVRHQRVQQAVDTLKTLSFWGELITSLCLSLIIVSDFIYKAVYPSHSGAVFTQMGPVPSAESKTVTFASDVVGGETITDDVSTPLLDQR